MRFFYAPLAVLLLSAAPASAADGGMAYYPDPVYKKLAPEDSMPMEEVIALAEDGDVRAQFIVGDLYAKGKGGLPKDAKAARTWFERAGAHGNPHAYLRLAALAKRDGDVAKAWVWYTLAIEDFGRGDEQSFAVRARNAWIEEKGLTPDDLRKAREDLSAWKDKRDADLRTEKQKQAEKNQDLAASKTPSTPQQGARYND